MGLEFEERKFKITFTTPCLAMSPENKELYTQFIGQESENLEEELEMLPEETTEKRKSKTIFHTDEEGIYFVNYQIKGFLKHAANVCKNMLKVKALRSKVVDFLFVYPRFIWIKEKPDGQIERPMIGQTARGQRISLACSDYVNEGTSIEFILRLYKHSELTWDKIESILDYGGDQGIGCWRGGGNGSFTWETISNGKISKKKKGGKK